MTDAESIVIHGAERVDFVINADADIGNYWIRAETLEEFSADGVIYFLFYKAKYDKRNIWYNCMLRYFVKLGCTSLYCSYQRC